MPRYFFDVDDGVEVRDHSGVELPSPEAARREAARRMSQYGGNPDNLGEDYALVVTVRDGPQSVVLRVRLFLQIETVEPPGGDRMTDGMEPPHRLSLVSTDR